MFVTSLGGRACLYCEEGEWAALDLATRREREDKESE
jgi:hypothetical protein